MPHIIFCIEKQRIKHYYLILNIKMLHIILFVLEINLIGQLI